jgi:hypothetical protein
MTMGMRSLTVFALLLVAGASVATSCQPHRVCQLGATQRCACAEGGQVCVSDGQEWGPCDCGAVGGGTSSSGATGGGGSASGGGGSTTSSASSSSSGATGTGGGGRCPPDVPANPAGVLLRVPELPQQCQEWCWAASIAMVADYYGHSVAECALAGAKTGGGGICCSQFACATGCNVPAQPNEIAQFFTALGVHGVFAASPLTEGALQTELTNGRPVYVMFANSFSGHAVVVTGYSPTPQGYIYHLVDPWYGPQNIPFVSVLNGPNGIHWAATMHRLRVDACP